MKLKAAIIVIAFALAGIAGALKAKRFLLLTDVPGVCDVHDLHVWTLTSGMNVATAHLVLTEDADGAGVLYAGQLLLRERFDIEHATLQVEGHRSTACDAVSW